MEDYPPEYTEHNLPLVLLSGLGHEESFSNRNGGSGTKLAIQTPECEGERASHLLQQFLSRDGALSAWNSSTLPGPNGSIKYRMQPIGRVRTSNGPSHFYYVEN